MFCVCVPEHLRSEELRHAGRGRCRDDVRSQEKLLGYRGQRPASCLHSCTRARWGRIGGLTRSSALWKSFLDREFSVIPKHSSTFKNCHLLQVMCWACLMMTPRRVRDSLGIWEVITWWRLCSSASTKPCLGRPAARSTLPNSLTTGTVRHTAACCSTADINVLCQCGCLPRCDSVIRADSEMYKTYASSHPLVNRGFPA